MFTKSSLSVARTLLVRGSSMLSVILFCGIFQLDLLAQEANSNGEKPLDYAIVIHGGAGSSPGNFSPERNAQRRASMEQALKIGVGILKEGGSSLDAVEAVVRFLEDDPQFNAGKGAVFNAQGKHELDASIMDGRNRASGAITGVTTVKNPIGLARKVMTQTRHILFSSQGAERFADEVGVERVDNEYFDTPATRKAWEDFQQRDPSESQQLSLLHMENGSYQGTVGCCALDQSGNLAAATSTGGLMNKQFGRVGDTPIIGAGTYADNQTCAVSCTGIGEQFMRNAIAYDVAARLNYQGQSLEQAIDAILNRTLRPGDGGIIAVDRNGNIVMQYNTDGMARAAADSTGKFEVLWDQDTSPDK